MTRRWKDAPLRLALLAALDWAVLGLLWAVHRWPLAWQARLGEWLGDVLRRLARRRRRIAATNLALCFPERSKAEREALLRAHFRYLGRSLIERGIAWFAPAERIRTLVRLEGFEHVAAAQAQGRAVILLAPHFLGLDIGGTRLTLEGDFVTLYARQRRRPVAERWLRHGRTRFGDQLVLARQDGIRPVLKALKAGRPFYYLPDLDLGARDAVFVPFFGVPAATVATLPRLVRLTNAVVLWCITEMLPDRAGYVVRISPPWEVPEGEETAAAAMNARLEVEIRRLPAQYFWVHRRFKTRPPGDEAVYLRC